MSTADERERLHDEFLDLAGRIARLVGADPAATTLNPDELTHWKTLFWPEAQEIAGHREAVLTAGATPSAETLTGWIAQARRILERAPANFR